MLFLYNIKPNLLLAREILTKALGCLPKRKHIILIQKAATYEYTYGSIERGKTIFEGLLSTYPKRLDLWNVYLDISEKHYTIIDMRSLYNRTLTLGLKSFKMKTFFKRYLQYEKKFGDQEGINFVHQKTKDFVENDM